MSDEAIHTARLSPFAAGSETVHTLSDGQTTVTVKRLNEGERRDFMKSTQKPLKVSQADQTVEMMPDMVGTRHALIKAALTDWNFEVGGAPLPFNPGNVRRLLDEGDPAVIDEIEEAARETNPWLLDDVSLDDLLDQREKLDEMIDAKRAAEEGNG